jgi:Co/Zn/Cd efflux system component
MATLSQSDYSIHDHVFLGAGHEKSERKTWIVIWLCGAMMVFEIVGGFLFGSIALVADGLHMSTHAGALLLAALAYTYSRKHAQDVASRLERVRWAILRDLRAPSYSR